MKNLATLVSFILIIALIPACEESPEVPEWESVLLSLIPGRYGGYTDFWGVPNGDHIKRIPRSFTIEILSIEDMHYTLKCYPIDSILPIEISGEITGFHNNILGATGAAFRVLENELIEEYFGADHIFTSSGFLNDYLGQKIYFNFTLTNKTQDSIYMQCHGERQY